ncbi:metal ABC transporter ATP-binding protein [Piscinibacter sakaiensis]|uniref:metal ABC transporter ATP-binding protein n=1 Tax=Piscinibacter sakaiensis TaxID=1547922 RepID=UPI003AADCD30
MAAIPAVPALRAVPTADAAPGEPPAAAVLIDNLTVSYRQHPAVHHVSCRFDTGSLTAIVGPNGAGKSSLLDALVGRIAPTTGRIQLAVPGRSRIAYLPQQNQIDRTFPLRVADVVMLGAWPSLGLFGGASAAMRERAASALHQVGLDGLGHRQVGELSVGQFQRVLFARVLLQQAPLILLDEPFNAIDNRTTADLLQLVHRWHAEGRTVVAVLHDLDQVRAHFPDTVLLAREVIAAGPSSEVLTPANLQRAREMAERWDDAAAWCHRNESGEPPGLTIVNAAGHLHSHAHGTAGAHTHAHGPADQATR